MATTVDTNKFFTTGNLCIRNGDDITILEDPPAKFTDNQSIWGTISRVTSTTGIGGHIVGNYDGYGCRFEIHKDSFNLGTAIKPTNLKIFASDNKKSNAVFSKDTGGLVLGLGKSKSSSGNVLETWGGITHWNGKFILRDDLAFLLPPSQQQLKSVLEKETYTFSVPASEFPITKIKSTWVSQEGSTMTVNSSDIIDLYIEGLQINPDYYYASNNSLIIQLPLGPFVQGNHTIIVQRYINDDVSLQHASQKTPAFHTLRPIKIYQGASLTFSSAPYPDENLVLTTDLSPKLVVKGPKVIDLGLDPEDILKNQVEFALPSNRPRDNSLPIYVDDNQQTKWSRSIFSKLSKDTVGVAELTNSQLIALVFELKFALEKLTGKKIKVADDYETSAKTGATIYPPGSLPDDPAP